MTKKISLIACTLALPLFGCPADEENGSGETGADDDGGSVADDDGTPTGTAGDDGSGSGMMDDGDDGATADETGADVCAGADAPGAAADGDACTANADCMSQLCPLFTDVQANIEATCAPAPAGCNTRVTATVFDFDTGMPVSGADVVVTPALNAATNPTMPEALVSGTSDGDGRIDATSEMEISAQIGVVALASAGGYYLTATGVAGPNDAGAYGPGNNIHDLFLIPEGLLTDWSAALETDPAIMMNPDPLLPLGDLGGVVGLVRNISDGTPVEGAQVVSLSAGSATIVRYLADDGTFNTDGTGPSGVFIVLSPDLGESFEAQMDGSAISGEGRAGSTMSAVFTMILNAG